MKKIRFLPECTANLNFWKCTVIFSNVLWIFLNVLWIWTLNGNGKKDRFLTKCTANVNFQRFLKILLLMILDAINRISFGNCRRSKGFQVNYRPLVNYGKPDFVNILSKFKFAVHFTLKFSSEYINSIIPWWFKIIVFIYIAIL